VPKRLIFFALLVVVIWAQCVPLRSKFLKKSPQEKEQILWQKLEATIGAIDRNLDVSSA